MKRLAQLTFVACLAIASLAASFPYVTLNNKTNRLSDNGSALTFNGSALGSGSITTNAPAIAAGSPAVFVSSNVLGAATSAQLQTTLGNVYQATNTAPLIAEGTLTHAGTMTLSFANVLTKNFISLTGSVTFAFSGVAADHDYRLRIFNGQATNIVITFPSGINTATNWVGGAPATTMAPSTEAIWSMTVCGGTTDGNVKNAWGLEQ